jgi:hypothetical protein
MQKKMVHIHFTLDFSPVPEVHLFPDVSGQWRETQFWSKHKEVGI